MRRIAHAHLRALHRRVRGEVDPGQRVVLIGHNADLQPFGGLYRL